MLLYKGCGKVPKLPKLQNCDVICVNTLAVLVVPVTASHRVYQLNKDIRILLEVKTVPG